MTIPPNDTVAVWTDLALLEHASQLMSQPGSYGSVLFRFNSVASLALHATSVPMLQGTPIAISILTHNSTVKNQNTTTIEGIWWHPLPGLNEILVVSNVSASKAKGTLSMLDASGKSWSKPLSLGPRQTMRVLLSDLLQQSGLSGSFGGISMSFPSSPLAFDVAHFLYDESGKFSVPLEMFRRDPHSTVRERTGTDAKEWTMRAPMLALRNPDPALGISSKTVLQPTIFVRNTTAKTISANITLNWRGDSNKGQARLPEFQVAPFATQQLQIGAMQKLLQIPANAQWALVSLTTTTQPDDLIAIASSRDESLRYGAETTFFGGGGGHFVGGEWRADAIHNVLAAITNVGTKPTEALLTLHYDNGKQKYELEQTIAPGDQMWVNLAQLIRNRVADRKGNTLPVDLNSVTYDVQDLTPGGHGLMASAVALDSSFGFQAGPPPILRCCGENQAGWDPGAFDLVIDGTDFGSIQGIDQCNGQPVDISSEFTTWSSGNSAVATVATKQVHAVGPGSTDAFASGWVTESNGSYCTVVHEQVQAPVNVCPSGTSVSALTPLSIVLLFPQLKTGIGAVASMQVNPTSSNWDGIQLTETVTQTSNTCPANFGNPCGGTGPGFTVGGGPAQASVMVNGVQTFVGPVFLATENIFYDQHTVTNSQVSLLDYDGINSCTTVCQQVYYCEGIPIGSHTITYSFIKAQITGTHVTSTEVSKQ